MSGYKAIADVGETLLKLLKENMDTELVEAQDNILLCSPVDASARQARLSLFLYSITENTFIRNQAMQDLSATQLQYPPLALDLHYLMTAYSTSTDLKSRTLDEHKILGRAMQIFYDNAILGGSALQGGLAEGSQDLRVIFDPMPLEELSKIWGTFPSLAYKTSVCYKVTPVLIDSGRITGTSRVMVRDMEYYQTEVK